MKVLNNWIELRQVEVYMSGAAAPVLHKLNLSVGKGEWIAVAGRNGSGKSVLARLLAGLDGRYDGEIGRSREGAAVRLVMQNPEAQLVGETVWEELCFVLECLGLDAGLIPERIQQALQETGLEGMQQRHVKSLSGGQKQLLALAGALAAQPELLVTDEATSMLDPIARAGFLATLRILHQRGCAIVMITQLLEEAVHADRIVALDGGEIVYDGGVRPFFYEQGPMQESPCDRAGLLPPYPVLVARELRRRGIPLMSCPLTAIELERAVAQI